ncbi:MAG: SDR family NAD(P)-dependent oxidoreductase [Alphaproteobacteria bacterium]|nr:MAG: SDR family NAD(P)-dependent oxidoreductase [Alphaproteobacteria bacterium]
MSKTFLSIGAGPGIGLATARLFAQQGFHVVLASRNLARLQSVAKSFEAEGLSIATQQVDASDPHAVARLVEAIGPGLQVMHYNAGILHYDVEGNLQPRSLQAESIETIISDSHVNVVSAMTAIKAALPALSDQPSATVLLTGGGLGIQPSGEFLNMSVGKAALRALALALFEPLKQQGVHVGTVTVSRLVSPDSPQAAEIAQLFWDLHAQPTEAWMAETVYQ